MAGSVKIFFRLTTSDDSVIPLSFSPLLSIGYQWDSRFLHGFSLQVTHNEQQKLVLLGAVNWEDVDALQVAGGTEKHGD